MGSPAQNVVGRHGSIGPHLQTERKLQHRATCRRGYSHRLQVRWSSARLSFWACSKAPFSTWTRGTLLLEMAGARESRYCIILLI